MIAAFLAMSLAPLPTKPVASDSIEICSLYTRDEVEAAAKSEALKPRESYRVINGVPSGSCWTNTRGDSLSVKVIVEVKESKAVLRMALDALKRVGNLKPISGLGDEAYWGQMAPNNGNAHFVIGLTLITVQTYGKSAGAGTLERTRPIAELVAKRYKERHKA